MSTVVHYSGTGCNRTFIETKKHEDSSVYDESNVLTAGMRDEMDAFYDRIDTDLALEGKGAW